VYGNKQRKCTKQLARRTHVYLYGAIKRCTGKGVCVFRIKCHLHDIMRMSLKYLGTDPALFPVPKLYEHIIRWWQHIRKGRMNCHTPNVICMCLKYFYFIHCVVIIYTNKHIVCPCHNPLSACNKLSRPNCKIKLLYETHKIYKETEIKWIKRKDIQTIKQAKNIHTPGNSVTSKDLAMVWNKIIKS